MKWLLIVVMVILCSVILVGCDEDADQAQWDAGCPTCTSGACDGCDAYAIVLGLGALGALLSILGNRGRATSAGCIASAT